MYGASDSPSHCMIESLKLALMLSLCSQVSTPRSRGMRTILAGLQAPLPLVERARWTRSSTSSTV